MTVPDGYIVSSLSAGRAWTPASPEATALVCDTSTLIDFTQHPNGSEILSAIHTALDLGRIVCVFPDLVLEEFNAGASAPSFRENYKNRARAALDTLRPFAARAEVDIDGFERALEPAMDQVVEIAASLLGVVKTISEHDNSLIVPTTNDSKADCFDRVRRGSPPDHRKDSRDTINRNSLIDHAIWLCVLQTCAQRAVIFCSNNKRDFGDPSNRSFEELHEVLASETKETGNHVVDFHDTKGFINAHFRETRTGILELVASLPPYCLLCGEDATCFSREPKKFESPQIEEMQCDKCGKEWITGAIEGR